MPSKVVDVQCSRCLALGHVAKDCTRKSFMRTETVAEERERKQREWSEKQRQKLDKQAAWEEIQRKKQERQAEWEQRRLKRQEQHVLWKEQQRKAKDKVHIGERVNRRSKETAREGAVRAHPRAISLIWKEADVKLSAECDACDEETSTRVSSPRSLGPDNATYDSTSDFPSLVADSKMPASEKESTSTIVPRNPRVKDHDRGVRFKPKTDPSTWPRVRSGELEFILDNPLSILPTRSVCSPSTLTVGNFSFKILVFPRGTSTRKSGLGIFVLAEPGSVEPDNIFKNVSFEIILVNWVDFNKSLVKSDIHSFVASGSTIDRGWHEFMTVDALTKSDSEWVGPSGSLCVRARCQVSSLDQQWREPR